MPVVAIQGRHVEVVVLGIGAALAHFYRFVAIVGVVDDELAAVIGVDDDLPDVSAVYVGFLGCWGEWHDSKLRLEQNSSAVSLAVVSRTVIAGIWVACFQECQQYRCAGQGTTAPRTATPTGPRC